MIVRSERYTESPLKFGFVNSKVTSENLRILISFFFFKKYTQLFFFSFKESYLNLDMNSLSQS